MKHTQKTLGYTTDEKQTEKMKLLAIDIILFTICLFCVNYDTKCFCKAYCTD